MNSADLLPTISSSLIKAAELAMVEDAPGTGSILAKLDALLKYTRRGHGDARFQEEWNIMTTLLELMRIQYPDRFSYSAELPNPPPMDFVPRGKFLEDLHNEIVSSMNQTQGPWCWKLRVARIGNLAVELTVGCGADTRGKILGEL
ncbi:MAG: hypothetical protein RQ801_04530 [Spirochaetaceae bacterium]|nr:hypothetical protein [Spirochaetaceae bacterium]MDT8297543.1 hypothetical protein [Spirochaetaceae bacterium]